MYFCKKDYYQDEGPLSNQTGLNPSRIPTPCSLKNWIKMVIHFIQSGYSEIILEPWTGQDKLLIGCGRQPYIQTDCGGYVLHDDYEMMRYLDEHNHGPEYYTIDPDLGKGAHTIALFGKSLLNHLLSNTFANIIFEGIRIDLNIYSVSLMNRLLKEDGIITSKGDCDKVIGRKVNGKIDWIDTGYDLRNGYPNVFEYD
jgi:hypothetical protein